MTWPLWYYYAHEPWRGAKSPRSQVPRWMDEEARQLRARVQQALETIQTPECKTALLDYDRRWQDSPALWVKLEVSDPTLLYTAGLDAFPSALRGALGNVGLDSLIRYLIREVCEYIVIIFVVRGRMLDQLVWPFRVLTVLQAEDTEEGLWAFSPKVLTEVILEELQLGVWDNSDVLTANRLSPSVATLRQLTSQISEFQAMPDLTEPGMERLQTHLLEELSKTLSTSLQTFVDAAAELVERLNALPKSEQQKRDKLCAAIEALLEAHEYVRPGEGNGPFKLELAQVGAYSERLQEIYPTIEGIRLYWIADIIEQLS